MTALFDILLAILIVASLPVCFLRPWIGSALWWWVSFMNPHQLATGFLFNGRFASLIAVATLAGLLVTAERYRLPRCRELYLLIALWGFCGLTTAVAALNPEIARWRLLVLSETLVMTFVVLALFQDRYKLTVLMWATALSLGWYAVAGAVWILCTGEVRDLPGPVDSTIRNNNDLAAALVAIAPFFVILGSRAQRLVRYAAFSIFAAVVVAILGTHSRAALLAIATVLMLILLGWRRQWRALALAAVAFAAFLLCTSPQKFAARVGTIGKFQQEPSAAMRPKSWYVALRLGLDHPLLGAGFRPFSRAAYERYIPGYSDDHDAHNIFLQVFAEHGFPGLILYTLLIASTLTTLWRNARRPRTDPGAGWIQDYAWMILIGLAGYLVAGQFHCLSYREILFHLLALAMIVDALARAPGHVIPIVSPHTPALRYWFDKRA
jgi:probable O-glycosylation ligase (exosortase A-associated)